jgi:hypothetical protein
MFFCESLANEPNELQLEIAHHFTNDNIWVKKKDIYNLLGLGTTDGNVGSIQDGTFKPYKWDEVKDDFYSNGHRDFDVSNQNIKCFHISIESCNLDRFENHWLPFPLFNLSSGNKSEFGPTNWCRCKLIPIEKSESIKKYNLLLAFDTRTNNDDSNKLLEVPVFTSGYERSMDFALCKNELLLIDFCSKAKNCEWVDGYIHQLVYNKMNNEGLNTSRPKLKYLAQYIFLLKFIQQLNVVPVIKLHTDNYDHNDVDLIVDMGNSRTCAVLIDDRDMTKVEPLGLYNLSNPVRDNKLQRQYEPFDMRLVFHKAKFGVDTLVGSTQFTYPSFVRLGNEAKELTYHAINLNTDGQKISTLSSPKRYLWDSNPSEKEWEFLNFESGSRDNNLLYIQGISEQLNTDGSLNNYSRYEIDKNYSRRALMTFAFLEILSQAKMQMNSYEFRQKWGEENRPRRLRRIIVTCPTSMSIVEQKALRSCAKDASVILDRFTRKDDNIDTHTQVIPEINSHNSEDKNWIYDEATCAQFVFLYSELTKRYQNNCKEYFDFYGSNRSELSNYNKKAITIGSVDIGAGSTDLMIASYKYDDSYNSSKLTPKPIFWESFYFAGDDLLKSLIRQLVVDGKDAAILNHLKNTNNSVEEISKKIMQFFSRNNAQMDFNRRRFRNEFNHQVSIPVIYHFLELLKVGKNEKSEISFDDIFKSQIPTQSLQDHFKSHFHFSIEDIKWRYDRDIISKIVSGTFETLIGKISTILSYYKCDIVLLSGRPTSLKPISDLFLKYYAVSPNRLISLTNNRVGTWYPFHDQRGYFKDSKSIVAIGALIGNYSSNGLNLDGFSLNLDELAKGMKPTTEYFTKSENDKPFISPENNSASLTVSQFPQRIWTRQLNSIKYPTRSFYQLSINTAVIRDKIHNEMKSYSKPEQNYAVNSELERLNRACPFTFNITRNEYSENKEDLQLEGVIDRESNEWPLNYFTLQVQSMNDSDNFWLETGEFNNISINI